MTEVDTTANMRRGDGGAGLVADLTPAGGWIMAEVNAYFDESGSHDGSPALVVAGCVFAREQALAFTREWQQMLDRYDLPYFRMSDCAHRTGPFAALNRGQTINCVKRAVRLIQKRSLYSFAAILNEADYRVVFPASRFYGPAYAYLARLNLISLAGWADRTGFEGRIAYAFEAGHRHQARANAIMQRIFERPALRAYYRYAAHCFADKPDLLPLQAADLLAWQWHSARKAMLDGRPYRAEFKALLRPGDSYQIMTPERLRIIADMSAGFEDIVPD